jgi:hypothetical protein
VTRTIRLESDWGLPPFYVDDGDGRREGIDARTLAEKFSLPAHVVATLRAWDKLYQDVLDWDDPRHSDWARPEDEQHYLERGRAAARLLRHHLPDDVRIEYAGAGSIPTEYY